LDFDSLVVNVDPVVVVDSFCVFKQFLEVRDVLFYYVRYVVQLGELVTVVIFEHALGTDKLMTVPAEVLDLPLLVHVAVYARVVCDLSMS
jgi:hypothetical protein